MEATKQEERAAVQILVVEDSPTQAEQLCHLLAEHGYATLTASNGQEGLEAARRHRPTLIISDIVMPGMDGYAMCRAIKTDPALKNIPVVMVTSLSGIQDIARSLECGADNFIRKPYEPKSLLSRIEYILLNQELRSGQRIRSGMEIYLEGKKHYISSEREQMIDLLISTYEEAVRMNEELRAQQQALAHSNQNLAGLYRIAEELNRVNTEAGVCERALATAGELSRFASGWIYLSDEDGGCRLVAAINVPDDTHLPVKAGNCACRQHLMSGVNDGAAVIECDLLPRMAAERRHASVPLRSNGTCLGIINLQLAAGESIDDEDLRMLDAIGSQVTVALERARLYEHLEALVELRTTALRAEVAERRRAEAQIANLNRVYAVLSEINSLIVRARSRDELFRGACRIAVDFGQFGLPWIGMVDRQSFKVSPVAWQGSTEWPGAGGMPPPLAEFDIGGDCVLARTVREGQAVVCRDLESCPGIPLARAALERGYRALVGLPLRLDGQPVGLLVLYAAQPEIFDEGELRLLDELAGDISFALDHLAKEARINYLAYYDALTGLPNRDLLLDRLNQGVGHARRQQRQVALICIDIDRFKTINDGLGHHTGDQLLKALAGVLTRGLDAGDTAGRLGGDKFLLVCCDLADADAALEPLLDRLHTALQVPLAAGDQSFRITASLGISRFPRDGDDAATLIKYADLAMSEAKAKGGNRHAWFTPGLDHRVTERLQVENRLEAALANGEFVIHYQPQVNAVSGIISGMEALIRWNHPEQGLVPPMQFIPVAEESGLIVPIGEWVLREACRQNSAWREAGLSDFPISVNLSMAQFRDKNLLDRLQETCNDTGLDSHALELELTESLVMDNAEAFIAFLHAVRSMGVQIAIDDFGTGYSCFNYLKRLPVDRLKIDYSFVRDITTDPGSASICRAIIAIAHNLRLGVVAEGVETEAQARYLARHHCDQLQGFHLCHPAPAAEITELLTSARPLLPPAPELTARRTLLLIDDDEHLLSSLRRLLRREGYNILTATTPAQAFELLAKNDVGVVVCDQLMPEMTGSELLSRIKEIYPHTVRIILSGYTDLQAVTASVNAGQVYKFLLKPWENEALRADLRDAFWQYELTNGIASDWSSGKPPGH